MVRPFLIPAHSRSLNATGFLLILLYQNSDWKHYILVLLHLIYQEEFWNDPTLSISKAYENTDQAILSQSSDLGRGGSTAVTAILINGQRLWIANVGDSRAVLSRKGQAVQMSTDHEPNTERGSIETKGGFVSNLPGT